MMKQVILIGAIAENGVYGQGRGVHGSIPWRSSKDMSFFKETTVGHTIGMGRGTWESIPPKYRPFAGRTNFVVTNNPEFCLVKEDVEKGVKVLNSIISVIGYAPSEKVFMIGAKDIWYNTIHHADVLLINRIGIIPKIDDDTVFFPELLDPEKHFERFVQDGEPTVLTENQGTEKEFLVTCYRYVRKLK